MSNEHVRSVLNNVLLALQVCLGLWQFLKLTPVGALVKGVAGWLLRPLGLSPTYARLQGCNGRVFKEATSCVTVAEDRVVFDEAETTGVTRGENRVVFEEEAETTGVTTGAESTGVTRGETTREWFYLDRKYVLKRGEGNKLFIDGKMSYYITDIIWENLSSTAVGVYMKGCKEFWKGVTIGGVMTASEVLDCLILDNHVTKVYKADCLLLPVDLSASEEKLLKILNMAGLFFQAKNVYWLIPTFFSLTSAILEFCTPLRKWLYGKCNLMFCFAMHLIVDQFSYKLRSQVYSLGNWVENLMPSNDIQLKVVRSRIISAVIGGGAKTDKEGATLAPHDFESKYFFRNSQGDEYLQVGIQPAERDDIFEECEFKCGNLHIRFVFRRRYRYCNVKWSDGLERSTDTNYVELRLNRRQFMQLCTLISCMAKNESGSLKSSTGNSSRVLQVRSLKESILSYIKSGFPPVYELQFDNAIIN